MEGPSSRGPSGALPEAAGGEPAGITVVPSRELHLLIQGLKNWYSRPSLPEAQGALGLITGEAGAGKTLLVGALRSALVTLGIRFHGTACYREHVPLEPVRDLLVDLLQDLLSSRSLKPHGTRGWEAIQAFLPELYRLVPEVEWPEAIPPFPALNLELDRVRVSDTIAQAIAAVAGIAPLVLTVENLHWVDPLSLDVFAALLRIAQARARQPQPPKLLLVATLRPEESAGLEPILEPRLRAFEVEVRGYSREDVQDQALSLGIDLPLTVREGLHRGAGTSPLKVLFCLSGVRPGERPVLESLPDDPSHFEEWFARLVLERFSALEEPERRAVLTIALLGRPHPTAFLASLWDPSSDDPNGGQAPGRAPGSAHAERILHGLELKGWIRRGVAADRGPGWVVAGEKIAQLVLESLPPVQRAALYREVAEALLREALNVPIQNPPRARKRSWNEILYHLARAPAPQRLVEVGLAAAREAEAVSASACAIEIYEWVLEALDSSADPSLFRETGEKLGNLLESSGFYREAIEILEKLAGTRLPLDPEARARHWRRVGTLHGKLGEVETEVKCYQKGLAALLEAGPSLERLKLGAHLARLRGKGAEGGEDLSLLREIASLLRDGSAIPEGERLEIFRLAEEAHYRRGEYAEALTFEQKIFELSMAAGAEFELLRSAGYQGHLHLLRNERKQARAFLQVALERARGSGNRLVIARFLARMGMLNRAAGETRTAMQELEGARGLFVELGRDENARSLDPAIAYLQLLLYDFHSVAETLIRHAAHARPRENPGVFPPAYPDREAREKMLRELRGILERPADPAKSPRSAELLWKTADLLVDAGECQEAGRLYEEALRSREAAQSPLVRADILQRAGRLHRLLGDRARALKCFEKSLEFLRAAPEKALLGNAYLEVGSIFLVQGEAGKAYDYLLRSFRLFVDQGDDVGLVIATLRLTEFLREVGLRDQALLLAESVAFLSGGDRLKRWQAEAYRLQGALASEGGDYTASGRCFAQAQLHLKALGIPAENAGLQLELGWENYRRENYPAALAMARQGIETARGLGAQDTLEDFLFLLGAVESAVSNRSKNFLRALEVLNQALSGARSRRRPSIEAQILLSIALIYNERGKEELGREFRERARAIVNTLLSRLPPELKEAVDSASVEKEEMAPSSWAVSP